MPSSPSPGPSPSPGLIVLACGVGPGGLLAQRLAAQGRTVALVSDGANDLAHERLRHVPATFDSREALAKALAEARAHTGPVDQIIVSALPAAALAPAPLVGMSAAEWSASAHATAKAMLHALQAGAELFGEGGSFTLLGPNVGLVGAAGLVPLCAGLEAQRSLAKSAARQWGARGIRLNWVAIASPQFDAAFGAMRLPEVPELGPPPPALGRRLDLVDDVMPVVDFLGSRGARGVTGATINLDGGDWMLP